MVLPVSSLSIATNQIAEVVRDGLNAAANNISVRIGHPGSVEDDGDAHQVNLFFYRFEPSGFQADAHPGDPWRMRLFCLVTPFARPEGDTVSAGENDLRILGEIVRVLHESPILDATDVAGIQVRMQATFLPVSDETLNQIWSTQGEVPYRPSVAYELALVPIVPEESRPGHFQVGGIGFDVRTMAARHGAFAGVVSAAPIAPTEVAVSDPGWVPLLCWVHGEFCQRTLAFGFSDDADPFQPQVWIAGAPDTTIQLFWELWQPAGFAAIGVPIDATPYTANMDPRAMPEAGPQFPTAVALPVALDTIDTAAQLLLYADRSFARIEGAAVETVRSNPLLLTLFRNEAP